MSEAGTNFKTVCFGHLLTLGLSLFGCFIFFVSPARAEEIALAEQLNLKAEEIIYARQEQITQAQGQVEASYGEFRITAPFLAYHHQAKEVYFPQGVTFFWKNLTLTATSAQLDLVNKNATAQNVFILAEGFYFHGREVIFNDQEISLKDAWVTTCDLTSPHWKVAAGLIAFYPLREELTSSGSRFQIGDITLLPLPSYTISTASLREGWFLSPLLPHIGSRPGDGLYFEQEVFFFPQKRLVLSTKLGYAVDSGFIFGGGTNLFYSDGGQARAALYYQTSGKWEGGVTWQRQVNKGPWQSVLSAKFTEREIIDPYRLSSRPDIDWQGNWPDLLPIGTDLSWQTMAGNLREEGGSRSLRLGLDVKMKHDLLGGDRPDEPGFKVAASFASQNNWYEDSQRWLRLPGQIEIKHLGPVFEEGLGYEHFFWKEGANRFNFERFIWPDHDEISGMFKIKMPGHSLSVKAYYDLEAKTWRKIDLDFILLTHCLRWQLSWFVKEKAISFGIALGQDKL